MNSRKRNSLSSGRAARLTFLSYNWKLMNDPPPKEERKEIRKQTEGNIGETRKRE
ncbi:hypothetical protein J6590_044620 [Homalodisca vitripennis]|nr:hypothetical protein J6590_044620 [Homalodisca vitripennis]